MLTKAAQDECLGITTPPQGSKMDVFLEPFERIITFPESLISARRGHRRRDRPSHSPVAEILFASVPGSLPLPFLAFVPRGGRSLRALSWLNERFHPDRPHRIEEVISDRGHGSVTLGDQLTDALVSGGVAVMGRVRFQVEGR